MEALSLAYSNQTLQGRMSVMTSHMHRDTSAALCNLCKAAPRGLPLAVGITLTQNPSKMMLPYVISEMTLPYSTCDADVVASAGGTACRAARVGRRRRRPQVGLAIHLGTPHFWCGTIQLPGVGPVRHTRGSSHVLHICSIIADRNCNILLTRLCSSSSRRVGINCLHKRAAGDGHEHSQHTVQTNVPSRCVSLCRSERARFMQMPERALSRAGDSLAHLLSSEGDYVAHNQKVGPSLGTVCC